jgi:hypothetical protein
VRNNGVVLNVENLKHEHREKDSATGANFLGKAVAAARCGTSELIFSATFVARTAATQ